MVVYQIYPRSFQDSDGDGLGDLRGIESRLDHLSWLGVDALWLSPVYPSPQADMGYDVSDYEGIDPAFGSLADFDSLLTAAHERGIRVLLDFVPSHTSIEHPWFREHPDWYIWSDRDGPRNNWIANFGGPAWSPDPYGRGWYLHSFYPEQPDLDWRNPEVVEAMQDAVRFWVDRGVDGFRLDALQQLLKHPGFPDNPPAREPFPLPLPDEYARLSPVYSMNQAGVGEPLAALREAADGRYLVGEVYLPADAHAPYLEHLDQAFGFELFHAPWDAESLRAAIGDAPRTTAWVLSNHDFPRLATRIGEENLRAAALLLLTLPGSAFVYQGDEIGLADGPGADPPVDRAGRDGARHPMQWDATATGGFSAGEPWLPAVDPAARNVAAQRDDPGSLLTLYRELIALRKRLGDRFEFLESEPGVLAYVRGDHVVAINTTGEERGAPPLGALLLATAPMTPAGRLAPYAGVVAHRS